MPDVMLDLETMGTGPDAAIVAIGAVHFNVHTRTIVDSFYTPVSLADAARCGGAIDPDTVVWWLKQNDRARAAISGQGKLLEDALFDFQLYLDGKGIRSQIVIWGNGADFDNVILAGAYRRLGLKVPWEFWNNRCYRTLKSMHRHIPMQRSGTHHNALDDAESQARHLMDILAAMAPAKQVPQLAENYGGST